MKRRDKKSSDPHAPRSFAMLVMSVLVGAALLTSCVTNPAGIRVDRGMEHADLPVKPNFEFVGSESFNPTIPTETRFRSWSGVYRGTGQIEDVGPWYVGAMKRNNWTLMRHFKSDGEVYHYVFTKANEEATLTIEKRYTWDLGKPVNFVSARIGPLGPESLTREELDQLRSRGVILEDPLQESAEEPIPREDLTDAATSFTAADEQGVPIRATP